MDALVMDCLFGSYRELWEFFAQEQSIRDFEFLMGVWEEREANKENGWWKKVQGPDVIVWIAPILS